MCNSKSVWLISLLLMVNGSLLAMTDPMQPPAYDRVKGGSAKKKARWQLTSTLIGQQRRLATINGKVLTVGQSVKGAKIIDIQPAVVTLVYQNRNVVLKLLPTLGKRARHKSVE